MQSHSGRGGRSKQKTLQLCSQIRDALSYALGDVADPVLVDLDVVFVRPIGGDRTVLVGVSTSYGHGLLTILDALERARGHLRSVVAEAVHRSKAPQLSFTVVPAGGDA